MININFNKTKSSTIYQDQDPQTNALSGLITNIKASVSKSDFSLDSIMILRIIMNLVLIACFPIALKFYETQEIKKLDVQKAQVDSELNGLKTQLTKVESELKAYGEFQDKSKEFVKKKDFLKELAGSRLIIPRALNLIQEKTPRTVWLEKISLNLLEKKSTVEISGKSFNEIDVNRFANSLHDILDKNSIIVDTRDSKKSGGVAEVSFSLRAEM